MKKAIVLLSGGLDSTTCLAIAKSQGFDCYALSFNYGQRNNSELNAARKIAEHFGVTHKTVIIPIGEIKHSSLTDLNIDVPEFSESSTIPTTYVPARNTIFLSFALAWAEVLNVTDIFIGSNSIDYPGYPDCRPEYISAFENMANLATKSATQDGNKIKIHTPLIYLKKSEIIKLGSELKVDYSMTVSCYAADINGHACGKCDSCGFRKKGFVEAVIKDQTIYVKIESVT